MAKNNKTKCKICRLCSFNKYIDFGYHPISHHYILSVEEIKPNSNIPIILGQCTNCGTIQLEQISDINCYEVRFPWVRQNEPEAHLDGLVQKIISLPDINNRSPIWGLSYKDESTVERFRKLGFTNCKTMDYATLFDSKDQINNITMIQSFITERRIDELQKSFGTPKIVISRHLLEHAHNTHKYFKAIKKLVSTGSYVVIEIPECSKLINNLDYTMLWEEHITYFTENILEIVFNMYKMKILYMTIERYQYEDCLIIILIDGDGKNRTFEKGKSIYAFNKYVDSFQIMKDKIYSLFNRMKLNGQKLAIYGSGHIASTFINIFDLSEHIEFIIDDDKNKEGLFMPGNGLPVFSSNKIITEKIDVCFIAMNYENEQKVIEKNQGFINNGGQFVPISTSALNSIYNML